jgi:predicted nucleic acid-binding protein
MTLYVVDTNVFSDLAAPEPNRTVLANLARHRQDTLCLCEAVDYEIRRGYLKVSAASRLNAYETKVKQQFQWVTVTGDDWQQAAWLWAETAKRGRAFSDIDLLIAAVAKRLDGVIVSADADFDALAVRRENWRISSG